MSLVQSMKLKKYFLLLLFFLSSQAIACPPGQQPAGPPTVGNPSGCVPYPGTQQSRPSGYWKTQWGAIAIGATNTQLGPGVGVSKNFSSKRLAEKAAIKQCKSNGGGKQCAIQVSYYNQCVVLAWGDAGYYYSTGATVEESKQRAIAGCSKSQQNCQVYYSDCSEPVWVQ
jgi:hypothetical protein